MPDEMSRLDADRSGIDAELRAWRAAHPDATLTEIEQAVDARLRPMRAGLLADLAGAEAADARCPACGGGLVRHGTRTRALRTLGDEAVSLTRAYATCPACADGLFPPR